jgi:hypothetical protein
MALEAISQWLHDPAFDEKFLPLRRNGQNGTPAPAAAAATPDAPAPPA